MWRRPSIPAALCIFRSKFHKGSRERTRFASKWVVTACVPFSQNVPKTFSKCAPGQTVLISIALFGSYSLSRPDGAITSVNSPSELPSAGRPPTQKGRRHSPRHRAIPRSTALKDWQSSLVHLLLIVFIKAFLIRHLIGSLQYLSKLLYGETEANTLKYSSVVGDSEIDDSRPV